MKYALVINDTYSGIIEINDLRWLSARKFYVKKQLPWPSGKSQACHAEGPGFAPGTLQGVLFPVAAHHTTLAWQWARDWGALFAKFTQVKLN